jgi:hypothetical protein
MKPTFPVIGSRRSAALAAPEEWSFLISSLR